MSIESASEPYIKASILTPEEYVGPVMELCREHRSESQTMNYLSAGRVEVISEMPLGEVLFDFYGKLKMITRGYGSFDYEPIEYRKTDVVKVDILVNKEPVDTLSYLVHRDKARTRALHYCERLAKEIPRHQFKIPIQGVIGGTVIARSTIAPYRKDVTEKLYGGDVTRKKKLLEKQKKGKAKMKQFGSVNIPQKAFVSVLAGRPGLARIFHRLCRFAHRPPRQRPSGPGRAGFSQFVGSPAARLPPWHAFCYSGMVWCGVVWCGSSRGIRNSHCEQQVRVEWEVDDEGSGLLTGQTGAVRGDCPQRDLRFAADGADAARLGPRRGKNGVIANWRQADVCCGRATGDLQDRFGQGRSCVGADHAKLATEYEMFDHLPDCEIGALPPFGSCYDMLTVADQSLADHEQIVFEGDSHEESIRMKYSDFCALERPTLASITA